MGVPRLGGSLSLDRDSCQEGLPGLPEVGHDAIQICGACAYVGDAMLILSSSSSRAYRQHRLHYRSPMDNGEATW